MKSMQIVEPLPPKDLASLQVAFGRAIATPFHFLEEAENFRVQSQMYPPEIVALMLEQPERQLDGASRLSTYNKQYWFRLLTIMQQEYPLTLALLGLREFNRMSMAYLDAFPSTKPSLRDLSNNLLHFLEKDTRWSSLSLRQAAELEYHFIHSFDAAERSPLDPVQLEESRLIEEPLSLQPHVRLFREDWNLVHWRAQAKASQAAENLQVELEPGRREWLIFRSDAGTQSRYLGSIQYLLLNEIVQGRSVTQAIEAVCAQSEPEDMAFLEQNLGNWFAEWMALGLFAHPQA